MATGGITMGQNVHKPFAISPALPLPIFFFHQSFHRKIKRKEALIKIFCFLILGETSVHIAIVNGDLESLKLLIEKCSADVHARARGRFFMPEDCKDKMKTDTDYDGE